MMWRGLILSVLMATPLAAQDSATLADIRQELSVLFVEIQRLKGELSTTGSPQVNTSGTSALARIDAIESELRRLTAQTEALELRVEAVAADGSVQLGDLEFRLCELEPQCDIATLGQSSTLGGSLSTTTSEPAPIDTPDPVVVGEQADFEAAKTALEAGDYATAATAFETFTQTYQAGALNTEAYYLGGEAQAGLGNWRQAARAYLDAFSGAPDGPLAPDALFKLGTSLAELGQKDDACLTLSEVPLRYPGASVASDAINKRGVLGCS